MAKLKHLIVGTKDLGKSTQTTSRVTGIPAEFRTGNLPNTGQLYISLEVWLLFGTASQKSLKV